MPLGPFSNIYGMGASPIIVGDLLVLPCDQSIGSYLMALDKRTGKVRWKVDRPEAKSGHSTPILWRGPDGRDQILLPGSLLPDRLRRRHRQEAVVGRRAVVRDEVHAGDRRRHDLRQRLRRAGERSGQQGVGAAGRGGLEDGRRRRQRVALEGRVPEVHRRRSGSMSPTSMSTAQLSKDEWSYYRAALDSENGMLAIRSADRAT